MNTTSSDNVGLYECIAVFSTAGYRNVTLERYNVTSSEPQSAGTYYILRVEHGIYDGTVTVYHVYACWIQ